MKPDRVADMYRLYGPVIYSRCRRFLTDSVAAEDATQEIFLQLLKHIDGLTGERAALKWIYRISTNHCLNALRNRERQAEPVEELPEQPIDSSENALLDRDLALKLIMRTPDKIRETATLFYMDGFNQEQVADTLGISRRTVISRLQEFEERARKLMLQDKGKEEP